MKAILTRYHGSTDCKGSRISASDMDGNRVYCPYDHSLDSSANHDAAVLALCVKMGWHGELVSGYVKGGCVYVFVQGERVKA